MELIRNRLKTLFQSISSKSSVLLIVLISTSLLSSSTTSATDLNPYDGTGDWIINTGETISGMNLTIDGHIIIDSPLPVSISFSNITLEGTIKILQGTHIFLNNSIINDFGPTLGHLTISSRTSIL